MSPHFSMYKTRTFFTLIFTAGSSTRYDSRFHHWGLLPDK
jgi:hypothetical protein